ncbi:protein phosphatase 1-binding protein bifocal [Holotrichia oblita]|uniref:Protein phosphatase 1-binding protein bifocal n=1 Tax=Holotrichia oblita TaxID=644536 RepID=A0ACB9SWJ3_HOLOL|nr:protein phosphatase 1-binding protein bifocal [Holotrichia oblita]
MLSNYQIDNIPGDTPLWLKELRLRKRNKQLQQQHSNQSSTTAESPQIPSSPFFGTSTSFSVTFGGITVQQPPLTSRCHTATTNGGNSSDSDSYNAINDDKEHNVKCNSNSADINMVQERPWIDHTDQLIDTIGKGDDSDSSEELKYGPGIVSKLKNRYLNLTLRETTCKTRPSILHLRKATSLEHILDDYDEKHETIQHQEENKKTERLFQRHNNHANAKNTTNRYNNTRTVTRSDMKRARSVEIISNFDHDSLLTNSNDVECKQQDLAFEETQIIEGSGDKTCNTAIDKQKSLQIEENKNFSNNIGMRLNRPKRIQPVMDEKEKPHPDIVKEKKKLFERAELRTKAPHCTGDVAAKVAGFKTIIDSTKASNKKPPIKQKPPHVEKIEKIQKTERPKLQIKRETSVDKHNIQIGSPIPPLRSPIKEHKSEAKQTPLPIIPDVSKVTSPYEEVNGSLNSSLSETPDLINHSSSHHLRIEQTENFIKAEKEHGIVEEKNRINLEKSKDFKGKESETAGKQLKMGSNSIIYAFSSPKIKDHLPKMEKEKTSPIKEKISPTKEIKERTSPIREKTSPIKERITSPKKEVNAIKPKPNQNGTSEHRNNITNSAIRQNPPYTQDTVPITEQSKLDNTTSLNNINKQKLTDQSSNLLKKPNQPPPTIKEKTVTVKQVKNNEISSPESRHNNKLSDKVIEKNLINKINGSASSLDKSENGLVNTAKEVPNLTRKKPAPKKEPQNSLLFDFTKRQNVPDYVGNDGNIKPKEKLRPKPGEGGIIILPGATIDETLVDDDEEDWKRLLECPPSPCNVTFTNDNILIEGRSSLKKLKKPKAQSWQITLQKSAFQVEEFQLGVETVTQPVTNTTETTKQTEDTPEDSVVLEEAPIQFSADATRDLGNETIFRKQQYKIIRFLATRMHSMVHQELNGTPYTKKQLHTNVSRAMVAVRFRDIEVPQIPPNIEKRKEIDLKQELIVTNDVLALIYET